MANKKFSEFTLKTDSANVDFVVGYDGTDNVRIAPDNLGGGGASDLNGLSDCAVDGTSVYVSNVPSGLSGNPANNVVFGEGAGNAITTGNGNTVIGSSAMDVNTDGNDNVAIGANALGAATSDGRTVAIGVNALLLQNQTFSPMNTAVGYAADDANVSGFGRTCIGASTGGGATGDNITNIGYSAVSSSGSVSNEITLGNSCFFTLCGYLYNFII
jgi:hypothetical protein